MELEKDWQARPVVRLDMSCAGASAESIRYYLEDAFHDYEQQYAIAYNGPTSLSVRFKKIIEQAYKRTGQQVAILLSLIHI